MHKNFPSHFLIDYVRVYQKKKKKKKQRLHYDPLGCSTPTHPSRRYIEGNAHLYTYGDSASSSTGRLAPLLDIKHGGGSCSLSSTAKKNEDTERGTQRHYSVVDTNSKWTPIPVILPPNISVEEKNIYATVRRRTLSSCGELRGQGRCVPKRWLLSSLSSSSRSYPSKENTTATATDKKANANSSNNISGECQCFEGFTGPWCLTSTGFDPVDYDEENEKQNSLFTTQNVRQHAHSSIFCMIILYCVFFLSSL